MVVKSKWNTTRTPYELTLVLWKKMAQGDGDQGISLWTIRDDGKQVPIPGSDGMVTVLRLDRDTIAKVRADIERLPLSLLAGLTPEVREFRRNHLAKNQWWASDADSQEDARIIRDVMNEVVKRGFELGQIIGRPTKALAAYILVAAKDAPGLGPEMVYLLALCYQLRDEGEIPAQYLSHLVASRPWQSPQAFMIWGDSSIETAPPTAPLEALGLFQALMRNADQQLLSDENYATNGT